ncbi:serine/threonine protein kinase [Anatilimnocola sp. NA78]|uniref:serine/threonine protein kinase n=1 Tax=Anatilimnocola sp. NA78 TaxID=3415683 RepID=UPI003CE4B8AE
MANLSPASDTQAFLDSLQTSQLLSPESMAKVREQFGSVDNAKNVARELLKAGTITRWQAGQLLHNFTALLVGNYKLLDQLGVGEMGRVYLAEHAKMQSKVALKVLARKHTAQPHVLRRILAEARRVAAIEHPHISHIQDVNQDGERYFIVLEYIDGLDLQRQVEQKGKFSPAQAWNYIRQAAAGLAYAHGQNVVHGGLKPSNLLTDAGGTVKILDFGLAQLATTEETDSNDSVDQVALTAKLYRAPEASQPATMTGDMYGLGATLYFLLTGKPPLKGPKSAEQLAELAPEAPGNLVELCRRLMSAAPADRPQNDQELLAAIELAKPDSSISKTAAKELPSKVPAAKTTVTPTKTTTLPSAKPLAEEPAAKAPPPRAKKPLTAKALPTAEAKTDSSTATASLSAADTPTESSPSDTPFAGFAIQTGPKSKGTAPAKSGAMPAINAAAPAPKKAEKPTLVVSEKPNETVNEKATSAEKPTKGKKGKGGKSNMPLILAGGIGGGVLVLGLIIGLVMFLMSGKGDKKEVAKADPDAAATTESTESNGEANPPTAAGEANPAVVESNPAIPTATVEANPMPVAPMAEVKPAEPVAAAPVAPAPDTKPAEPPMTAVASADPVKPESKPEPKPEPKPAPKATPKPAPKPAAPVNPFAGFAATAVLPKVPSGVTEAPAEMLVPVVLGPCKVPDENTVIIARLKGANSAYGKGKMKFTLEAANGGTSLRDWDIKVGGEMSDAPVVVATLSAKNDQLTFQWTADAIKQPAAPYLVNCALDLAAGNGKAVVALREPVTAEAIPITIDKRGQPAKFNIDLPPDPKQLMFEITAVEGDVPKVKYDNKDIAADKSTTFFWVGNVETEMPLGIKIDTTVQNGKTVQVIALPHFKLEGVNTRPEAYEKKKLQGLDQSINQKLQFATGALSQAAGLKDKKQKDEITQQATLAIEPLQKAKAQLEQLVNLAKGLQSNGKIQFRIYANAEDDSGEAAKIVLVQSATGAPPAEEKLNLGGGGDNNKKKL